ncbi:MAG: TRAP transporter substrate-binding protein DctP [Deltaproteobacteria bacterium]|nr:TRAP transporter substrate-binding protein DctP [Deltaproteobacteria bacterium]
MASKRSASGLGSCAALLLVGIAAAAFILSFPRGAAAKDVTLKFASHQPVTGYLNHWAKIFIDRVNKEVEGVSIQFLGGPEVVPPFEALKYINRGTVDLYLGTPGFFAGTVPVGLASYNIFAPSNVLRGTDFFQLMDRVHRERGVTILGDLGRGSSLGCFLKKPLAKADFSGLKLRTTPHLNPLVQALGGSPVVTAPGEVYTALERGVVDGFLYPQGTGIIETKWYEVVGYVLDPMVPYTGSLFLMGNHKSWDSLPENKKTQIMAILKALEDQSWGWNKNDSENALNDLLKSGSLKKTVLPPAEAEKYRKTARDALWGLILSKDSKHGPAFKAIDQKAGMK